MSMEKASKYDFFGYSVTPGLVNDAGAGDSGLLTD